MSDRNVTLVGYRSKRQAYIYPIVSVVIFITAILCFFFAEGNKKYASIGLVLIAIGFLAGFCSSLKQPKIALKVFDDRYISFYSSDGEKQIDLNTVIQARYWPAKTGLEITFVTEQGREHFAYLLDNAKQIKEHLLDIFEKNGIEVIRVYTK